MMTLILAMMTQAPEVRIWVKDSWRKVELPALPGTVRTAFEKEIPAELKRLAEKRRKGALTKREEERVRSILAINRVKNRYEFSSRILGGDPSVEKDAERQKKHGWYLSEAALDRDRRAVWNGRIVAPEHVILAGGRAFVLRDANERFVTGEALLEAWAHDRTSIGLFQFDLPETLEEILEDQR